MKQIKQPWTHTMLTTTFWILVKTYIKSATYNVNNQFIDLRQKLCTNEIAQTTIFSIDNKNVLTLKTTYTTSFSFFSFLLM